MNGSRRVGGLIAMATVLVTAVTGVASAQGATLVANPDVVHAGDKVTITGAGWLYVDGGCEVEWDGAVVASGCTIGDDGLLSGSSVVPDSAPGPHDLTVCAPGCGEPALTVTTQVVVSTDLVRVPDLVGSTYDDAGAALVSSGLRIDSAVAPPNAGAVVVAQEPVGGVDVERDTEVTLVFDDVPEATTTTFATVEVPDLSGLTHSEASAVVAELGLAVVTIGDIAGLVVSQDPAPGAVVPPGSVITVTMDPAGPGVTLVVTPEAAGVGDTVTLDGAGWPYFEGSCAVEWEGTSITSVCAIGDDGILTGSLAVPETPPGPHDVLVCAPGCLEPTLSRPAVVVVLADLVAVPDLLGSAYDEVVAIVASAGLVLDRGIAWPEEGAIVVDQHPVAGELVAPGSVVAVVFEVPVLPTGPVWVAVPDLDGYTPAEAVAAVDQLGLHLSASGDFEGRVASQDPAPGTLVLPGATVRVVLGRTDPMVVVPDLRGLDLDEAARRLGIVGLVLGDRSGGEGPVESQDPIAGSPAVVGSAVDVQLAPGPVPEPLPWWPVAVPVLVGAATGTRLLGRRRHARRWARRHVRVVPVAATPTFGVTSEAADHAVSVELLDPDPTNVLEEARP